MRSRKGREGSGRQICLEQNTVDSVMFCGRNASRTNRLQSGSLLSVHSTLPSGGVEGVEVAEKTVRLSVVPAGLFVGLSEDFGGWGAKRSEKIQRKLSLRLETC